MSDSIELRFAVEIDAPVSVVWERASSLACANKELWPLARMTFPFELDHRTPPEKVVGKDLRTWTFALGVFPIDRRTIRIDVFEHGRFSECSTSWMQGHACHERTAVAGTDGGTVVTDTLVIETRGRLVDAFMTRAISQTFRRRHRRLRKHFDTL